jgi:hypothetical protein
MLLRKPLQLRRTQEAEAKLPVLKKRSTSLGAATASSSAR